MKRADNTAEKPAGKKAVQWTRQDGGYEVVKNYKPAPTSDKDIEKFSRNLLRRALIKEES